MSDAYPSIAPEPGQQLPPLRIDVTTRLIVAGALASRDFQDVHHDVAGAHAAGSPDIFMNILTTNGLVGRYVTDWAGPTARLVSINIRLGAPSRPGSTLDFSGQVTEVRAGGRAATVEIRGANALGNHVTGTVEVSWS
jgi:acyl dehydratase